VPDIFLSYSRKDSAQALSLADRLRSQGLDVWIDQHGLEAAKQWSKEIVDAIETSHTFIVLLSRDSLQSKNVLRELSIASESDRTILPVELEQVILTSEFKYQLAGIQRAQFSDFDGILRSLRRAGLNALEPVAAGSPTAPVIADTRKSLMVLPFEDLSPAQDNGWFADGLTGELISAMTNIKSLRLIDRQTTMSFKDKKIRTAQVAKELNVRYFLEGSVRKIAVGPETAELKINVELIDMESGDNIWQYAHRGTMNDIFLVQETVANKVVEGLKLHVTKEETSRFLKRETQNPVAYELFMRGLDYFHRETLTGYRVAASFFNQAVEIDPNYADALLLQAATCIQMYDYEQDPAVLDRGERLLEQAMALNMEAPRVFEVRVVLAQKRRLFDKAEAAAKEYIAQYPNDHLAHFHLGVLYIIMKRQAEAIAPLERALDIQPEHRPTLWGLVLACEQSGQQEKRKYWAEQALTVFAKHLRLHPEDESSRVKYANLLMDAGYPNDALSYIASLEDIHDARKIYEIGLLALMLGDKALAMKYFTQAVDLGHKDFSNLQPAGEDEEFYYSPEFQALLKRTQAVA